MMLMFIISVVIGLLTFFLLSCFFKEKTQTKNLIKNFDCNKYYIGVELGGQSIKAGISKTTDVYNPIQIEIIHTVGLHYKKAFEKLFKWIHENVKNSEIESIGIGSFGPLDLNRSSDTYGYITTTPKVEWRKCPVYSFFQNEFEGIRIEFDTDVNAPALSESAINGNVSTAYITCGTGLGVGLVINGAPVHGLIHPEGGHMFTPLHDIDIKNDFPGVCEFHDKCLEGYCNAASIAARKNLKNLKDIGKCISDDDEVWDIVAFYLANLCCYCLLLVSVEKIIIGGGIIKRNGLLDKIRKKTVENLGEYLQHNNISDDNIGEIIDISKKYGENSGLIGCLELARRTNVF